MADAIFTDNTTSTGSRWLAVSALNPHAQLRLFCFPYSGAGAFVFRAWLRSFPAHIEVCPVRLPGRESRIDEPLITEMQSLAQMTAAGLRPYLDRPFAFFGHSMGALLSFELARYLRRHHGISPVRLFVGGHGAPHLANDDPPMYDLPEIEFVTKLRDMNGTPEEVLDDAELRQLILPTLRADFAVCETYVYEDDEPLDCPISAFGGAQDTYVSRQDLEAWRAHTASHFAVRVFPGDHFFLKTARSFLIRAILRDLESVMNQAQTWSAHESAAVLVSAA